MQCCADGSTDGGINISITSRAEKTISRKCVYSCGDESLSSSKMEEVQCNQPATRLVPTVNSAISRTQFLSLLMAD